MSWMLGGDTPVSTGKEQGRGQAAVLGLPGDQGYVDQAAEMAAGETQIRLQKE